MRKLAIIITHPIQYYSPLFKLLAERNKIQIKVFYTWEQSKEKVFDQKFGREIKWDIPLLDGYDYAFVKNISKNPGSGTFNGVVNPTLISEIEEWKANAILVFGWNHHSHFKAMRYFKGKIPVYFRGDSTLIDEVSGIKTVLRRIWLKFVYRYVDFAFYVGQNNKKYFIKHGLKEEQLIFAPHAVDNQRFFDVFGEYLQKSQKWRKELGLSEKDIVFLFVGKFENKKNPLLLIEASKYFLQYKFLFVGNGELEKEMRVNAGENVLFLPFQNQSLMPIVYRLGDVFVLPSKGPGETWGLAVNEAMACGKPILVSDNVGCAVDLIENGENGFVFKSVNVSDFVEKIKLFENNLVFFGEKSLKKIGDWSFKKIADAFEIINE
ncbi:MAG: glycosyltransferase family 4 protein [Bacteroidales bacterium]|nr:glycosyltransferase family 4 protein [Bacteroidales bacterium]